MWDIGQVLLVGKDEDYGVPHLLVNENVVQLGCNIRENNKKLNNNNNSPGDMVNEAKILHPSPIYSHSLALPQTM